MRLLRRVLGGADESTQVLEGIRGTLEGSHSTLDDINRKLDEGHEAGRKDSRSTKVLGIISAVAGVVAAVLAYQQLVVSQRIESGVRDLNSLSAQEVVDRLSLDMTERDLRDLLQVEPVVDQAVDDLSFLDDTIDLRRQVFNLTTKHIVVMALLDDDGLVRMLAVTSQDGALRLGFPADVQGDYAGAFRTGLTTLESLVNSCLDSYNDFGLGGPWGYYSLGCEPRGVNNFGTNLVAINMVGPGLDQKAFVEGTGLGNYPTSGELDPDVAQLTFNSFGWLDYEYLFGTRSDSPYFDDFVDFYEIGPRRGEDVTPFTPPVSAASGP